MDVALASCVDLPEPDLDEAPLATAALARVSEVSGELPMYARVDVAPGPAGDPLLPTS